MSNTKPEHLKVVILCGGMGTRLREETEYRPKPMVEIGGRPILWHIMKIYSAAGFNDFVLCLGYKGTMIKEYFLNYHAMSSDFRIELGEKPKLHFERDNAIEKWDITLADTGLDAMTGARVKRIERYVDTQTFMLTYGDGVADIDIRALLKFHRSHGKLVTVTAVRPPSRFGELKVEKDKRVTQFNEKPQVSEGMINGGFFVCEREFFKYISANASCILEQEPLRRVAADGQLAAYEHKGFWQPMDTFREFELLNNLWQSGKAPWKIWK
jgi:glucose-1-phosphate cytidylyltransferase